MRLQRWVLLLTGLLASPGLSFALDPTIAPSQYICTHWGRQEGIPDTSVFAVTQTRDGCLWLGTEMGPVRFDGVRFSLYGARTTPAFETSMVTSLLETRDGALLLGTRGGLQEYRGGSFRRISLPGGPEENIVSDLFQDASGQTWVSSDGDLGYLQGGAYRIFEGSGGETLRGISRVRQTPDGALWFSGGGTVHVWKGGSLGTIQLEDVSQTLTVGASGRVWAYPPGRMQHLAGNEAEPDDRSLLAGRTIVSALEDRDGTLWLGTMAGLLRFREGRLSSVDLSAGHPSSVSTISEDREGRLWIGTIGEGLFCLQNPLVRTFGKPEGLDTGSASTVLQARDGAFWIGTASKGLIRWDGREVRSYGRREGIPSADISALLEDSKGTLWVGTPGGLMRAGENGRFVPVPLPSRGIPVVFSLAELPDGTILAGTSAGVLARGGGRWEVIDPPQGYGYALAIEPARGGGAWIATLGRGLLRWDGRSVRTYGPKSGLPSLDIPALCTDAKGRLWIATTDRGIATWDGKAFRILGPAEGLPVGPVYQILETAGSLWLSGKAGVTHLAETDLEGWLEGREGVVHPLRFGASEGMRNPECNGGYQPAGCKDRDGALWFPTVDGIVRIDPVALSRPFPPPQVHVEEVFSEGKPAMATGDRWLLPPGRVRFEVRYTAPSFLAAERLRFEYRLEGFDADWVDAGPERYASYTNLPPGRFRFRVRARYEGGAWSESTDPLMVQKAPHLWQTWPFLLACSLLLAALFYGAHRLRLGAIRRRFGAVIEERNRISREIHDSLTQSFAGVVLHLEAADRSWGAEDGPSRERVLQAKAVARAGLDEARRFVRGLRPVHLEAGDLASALEKMAREAAAGGMADVTFRCVGRRRPHPPRMEDHLFRIAQEAVGNASRHAGATEVRVELSEGRSEVKLTVEDNGRGFDPSEVVPSQEGGYGLRGMRERVEEMKGALDIRTAKGGGTRIEIRVPV